MTKEVVDRGDVDWVLPGWTLTWSFVLSTAVFAFLSGPTSDQLSDDANRILGLALGGLFAAWTTLGTWSVMIDLPSWRGVEKAPVVGQPNDAAIQQQLQPRVTMTLVWLVQVGMLTFLIRGSTELQNSGVFGFIVLFAALSFLVPLIVWQWTYRRIHRGIVKGKNRRSIRQILGLTAVMAFGIATLQLSHQALEVPFALIAMALISSVLWIVMLATMLGTRWWMIFISFPLVVAQLISISFLVDSQSINIEAEIMRSSGFVVGFYLCALLLLALARSSSHRWVLIS